MAARRKFRRRHDAADRGHRQSERSGERRVVPVQVGVEEGDIVIIGDRRGVEDVNGQRSGQRHPEQPSGLTHGLFDPSAIPSRLSLQHELGEPCGIVRANAAMAEVASCARKEGRGSLAL